MIQNEEIDGGNDGGPAFPTYGYATQIPGMSLRDWFAGQALAAIYDIHTSSYVEDGKIAFRCYAVADEMLKEREAGR